MIKKDGMLIGQGNRFEIWDYSRWTEIRERWLKSSKFSLPKEFELEKYIDYDMQFEKAFVEPLKGVLDVIGWDTERRSSLDSFFT